MWKCFLKKKKKLKKHKLSKVAWNMDRGLVFDRYKNNELFVGYILCSSCGNWLRLEEFDSECFGKQ